MFYQQRIGPKKQHGVIAVESAFALPLTVILLLGMVDVSRMHLASRKAITAAQSASDLVAQETTVDATRLGDIGSAVKTIMLPFPEAKLSYQLLSVEKDWQGDVSVGWRYTGGLGSLSNSIPNQAIALAEPNGSVIAALVSYNHAPLFGLFPSVTFTELAMSKPRKTPVIPMLE